MFYYTALLHVSLHFIQVMFLCHVNGFQNKKSHISMKYIEKGENKLQVKRDLSELYFFDIRTMSIVPVSYTHLTLPTILLV